MEMVAPNEPTSKSIARAGWSRWVAGLALVALVFIAYAPTLPGFFSIMDDPVLITRNPRVIGTDGLSRIWFSTEEADYFPITYTAWWIEWRLFGANPMPYRLVNIALHAISAILAWRVLQKLKVPAAWTAAALFAVHPVNVASVAWISELKNTLSLPFFLLAILGYLHFEQKPTLGRYVATLALFAAGLLSKTSLVMLPVVLLLCAFWQRRRIDRRDLVRTLPFFALSAVMGLVTIWFQHHNAMGGQAARTDGLLSRIAVAGCAIWFYLGKDVWPIGINLIYRQWDVGHLASVGSLAVAALVGVFAVAWACRRSWGTAVLVGLGYFVVMLFPVLGFFDMYFMHFSLVADHWQYAPMIGVMALISGSAAHGLRRHRMAGRVLGTIAIGSMLVLCLGRSQIWASNASLWSDTVRINPEAWIARNNLALSLINRGQLNEAQEQLEACLALNPGYLPALFNLGTVYEKRGEIEQAIATYEKAIEQEPRYVEAWFALGKIYSRVAPEKAGRYLERAVELDPTNSEALVLLVLVRSTWTTGPVSR